MRTALLSLAAFLLLLSAARAGDPMPHHDLHVRLDPATHGIEVTDTVTLPPREGPGPLLFLLHDGLEVESRTEGVTVEAVAGAPGAAEFGMAPEDFPVNAGVPRRTYAVAFAQKPEGPATFTVAYKGAIHHPIQELATEYARGFSLSPGLIEERGVFLGGSTWWTPWFDDRLFTFTVTVSLPEGWDAVSQGTRTRHEMVEGRREACWDSKEPMEEVYICAARFTEYEKSAGAVSVQAFLRTPDENLANKYLETTAQYLEMYRGLIGPFPFTKFALVENFWQTGYGMPSFTLLGDQIIRLPFILHSSYPHELLHNWWGNSVYVDGKTGNWCEGITAYMADHLIAEQRGQGDEYRRTALQKYTDYVTPESDFPLAKFRSRFNAASEAVGYGKSMMMCNMLREQVGDALFAKAWQTFYRDNKFRAASFADVRAAFEAVSGKDLGPFFAQWVGRTGAPLLRLAGWNVTEEEDAGIFMTFRLEQIQEEDAFALEVPVAVRFAGKTEFFTVSMTGKSQEFYKPLPEKPLLLMVDPQFQLFRRLDPLEVPPSLSRIYGSEKILILLPSKADAKALEGYRALAETWSKDGTKTITVALDVDVPALPADAAVWVFGDENLHEPLVRAGLEGMDASLDDATLRMGAASFERKTHSCVVAVRHPKNPSSVLVLLTAGQREAVDGLSRKLLHYGKYSALVFVGAEPTNIAKETWSAVGSPLVARLNQAEGADPSHAQNLPRRPALARLAPVFSADRMRAHVKTLASDEMEGRGLGTAGIEKAAAYIAERFAAAGLQPGGDGGTFLQAFEGEIGPDGKKGTLKNVIGILPGTKPELAGQSAVVCAHYDHLGRGWPDAHAGDEGKIHPGADDNASGVAVLLELAEILGKSLKPERTLVFAAFTAEENGLKGSRHYVKAAKELPAGAILGALNLDTVGRLGAKKLLVIDSASAREWKFIFMGCGYVTGVESEMAADGIASGDQAAFLEAGIPAVQLFGGAHGDYHRPTDTADKVDGAGLVKVAAFAREAALYLAARPEPLTFLGAGAAPKPPQGPKTARRATTGSMPDFAFKGPGVRIGAMAPGSPAEKAGLKVGDVIVKIGGKDVPGLREYSEALKAYQPGDEVELVIQRDGVERTVNLVLGER